MCSVKTDWASSSPGCRIAGSEGAKYLSFSSLSYLHTLCISSSHHMDCTLYTAFYVGLLIMILHTLEIIQLSKIDHIIVSQQIQYYT